MGKSGLDKIFLKFLHALTMSFLLLNLYFRSKLLLSKGQIISECLFNVFKFSKKPTKNLTNFCPEPKKWSNHKITAPPYSVFNTLNSSSNNMIMRKCLYFVDFTTFLFLGRNLSNFSLVFWKILEIHKDILKLSDL